MIPVTTQQTVARFPGTDLTPLVDRLSKRGEVNRPGASTSAEFTALLGDLMTSIDREQGIDRALGHDVGGVRPEPALASAPVPAPAPSPSSVPPPAVPDARTSLRLAADRYRQTPGEGH